MPVQKLTHNVTVRLEVGAALLITYMLATELSNVGVFSKLGICSPVQPEAPALCENSSHDS